MDASRTRAVRRCVPLLLWCLVLPVGCTDPGPPGGKEGPTSARAATSVPRANELQSDYQRVIRNVLPSVVQLQAGDAVGSGVVYDGKGHIVTNAHVVSDYKTFKVITANSQEVITASLVFSYPQQDLAVIRLDRMPAGLRPAVFGDSAKVEVGQIVLAMGSPLGLSSSVTDGIVSATGRTVSEGGDQGGAGATLANMVQTSAEINPGNSGGALVDLNSHVIGIPTLAAVDPGLGNGAAPGIGFAIPASQVKRITDQIIKSGRVTNSGRAALDITGRTVVNGGYRPIGVAVVDVQPGGAADKAGLKTGDVIVGLGDRRITTITSLAEALAGDRPGQRTTLTYTRRGVRRTVGITLSEQ
ncbi:trypsin-like peptidase domain-containing protein [Streptomyces sp. NPDC047079]|uniref:S1C family serine protease n=1 Tax=Streptomyces sp. NPDC047079 TaxID=3154607 RepID=UPI0033CDC7FD